jgi:two-component system, response regulator
MWYRENNPHGWGAWFWSVRRRVSRRWGGAGEDWRAVPAIRAKLNARGILAVLDQRRRKALDTLNEVEILLVEDNPYDAELTQRALKNRGLANKLLTFTDGVEALDFLFGAGDYAGRNLALRPKVILLDLKLPRINGLEVLEKIRADERTRTIPVVIMTSSQEESDIVSGYNLGVNSYMVKPVDFDKFFQAVENLGLYWLLLNKVPH